MTLCLAQEPRADALLTRDPFALLLGMLLDQQMPMERAFAGPLRLLDRFAPDAEHFDVAAVADAHPETFAAMAAEPPAVHRFPGSMAVRIQALARVVVDEYGGRTEDLWESAANGGELVARLEALPGFGEAKARIFAALLGKQLGVRPRGWRAACAPYGEARAKRSAADVTDKTSLLAVRAFKKQVKQAAR